MGRLRSRTITLLLDDGTATGIRHAELLNWTGQAIACPRNRLGLLAEWPEVARPGVYFLFSQSDSADKPELYIGESENVFVRLQQHLELKDFWREAVVFTSKDENLTKAHVRYLESKLYALATAAGRGSLTNGNAPSESRLPRSAADSMDEFIDNLRIILAALGHRELEPLTPVVVADAASNDTHPSAAPNAYSFETKGVAAKGVLTDEGFVILAGSTAASQVADSMPRTYSVLRDALLRQGVFEVTADLLKFKEDCLFGSPSAAASIVAGNSRNGRVSWKTLDGKTLAEVEEQALSSTAAPAVSAVDH